MPSSRLIILDPGLANPHGHHALIYRELAQTQQPITVYAHHDFIASELVTDDADINVNHGFSAPFYRLLNPTLAFNKKKQTEHQLAREYRQCFKEVSQQTTTGAVVLHSLGLSHLTAVYHALKQLKPVERPKTLVLTLLYRWPRHQDWIVKFILSAMLSDQHPVTSCRIYVADAELQQHLAELGIKVLLHPCCAIPASTYSQTFDRKENRTNSVIAYLGDAKHEKGFTTLPEQLKQWVKQAPETEFVVHYTLTGKDPALKDTDQQLQQLANSHKQIRLLNYWLDNDAMVGLVANTACLVLNYKPPEYSNKSSGFLWLAALLGTSVVINNRTWLAREASRLNLTAYDMARFKPALLTNAVANQAAQKPTNYRKALFRPFNQWLLKLNDD
ncbi:hypothetical protein [Idiomarina sp.]|uniref:hypothetical protein n=1 Tax=Idiomarina sp. TaxID=1874361 RepID=UPI0025BDA3C3|nr:hypothetical protein [Idiomarina sp.]